MSALGPVNRLFDRLRPVIRFVGAHPATVLVVALLLSALAFSQARTLRIDTDIANLIPDDYPSKVALERLRATVGGESEAEVGIVSPSFEANRAFAEDFIERAMALRPDPSAEPYLTGVEYRQDTEFLKSNALYFASEAELNLLEDWLADKIEESRLEANPFFFDLGEDEEGTETDSVAQELENIYDNIVAKEYPVSEDSTVMALKFYPSGSQTDVSFTRELYAALEGLAANLEPSSYHPEMEVVFAGRLLRSMVEVETIQEDVLGSFGAGALAVLLMVLAYFAYKAYRARSLGGLEWRVVGSTLLRLPVLALVVGIPLLMSLSWTFGVAALLFGTLNLMTSTLGLVLFGLGIDFGIHFYARYTEERAEGRAPEPAIEHTFVSTGMAIAVGAVSTAAALLVLVFADFRGFSQFGAMAGMGILFALLAMMLIMPALLVLFERLRLLNLGQGQGTAPRKVERGSTRWAKPILAGSAAAIIAAVAALGLVEFEYRFGELEPTYAEYNEKAEIIRRVHDDSNNRNPAYIVLDEPAEVPAVVRALRQQVAADTTSPTVDRVESLQERFPTAPADQQRRLARIADIRAALADPFLESDDSEDMQRLRRAAGTTEPIALEQVPDFLVERFSAKDGTLGNFVIIYPAVGLSDGRQSIAFAEDIGRVETEDGVYHAGSSSLVAADMLKLMQRESPWMVLATLVMVVLLMWLTFGQIRWAMLAVLPLLVGVLWMLLLVEVLGLRINFYNLIVLPAVLGIGNDAGVHLVSRYREKGRGSMPSVLRTTGEHVSMGSLTTMVGFAGLLLSFHPGLRSIGELAVVGIGATLAAALLFLPALISVLEGRQSDASDPIAPEARRRIQRRRFSTKSGSE
ncbi:MAG: MMPL family transporter [Rhodothermales bacterium]|nr:MMPL family transporter [Rhodothermales bacterium]MBO6778859.1 MMPL family transporter [Rhodothermales bacterium]